MWEKNCRGAEIVLQDGLTQVGSFFKIVILDVSCLFFFWLLSRLFSHMCILFLFLSLSSVYSMHHTTAHPRFSFSHTHITHSIAWFSFTSHDTSLYELRVIFHTLPSMRRIRDAPGLYYDRVRPCQVKGHRG